MIAKSMQDLNAAEAKSRQRGKGWSACKAGPSVHGVHRLRIALWIVVGALSVVCLLYFGATGADK
jgi:hypothetical protein